MKKYKLFVTCFFCLISFIIVAQWELQNPTPINAILYDIHFVNASHGWAIGEFGSIQHSSDGGVTWEVQFNGEELWEDFKLNALYFSDPDNGWVVGTHKLNGDKGIILHTSDGGINWESQSSGNYPGSFNDITFVDQLNGWVVGDVGHILQTNDGGLNWISHYMGSSFIFRSVSFTDVDHGWIAGSCTQNDQGIIYRTDNAGLNWESNLLDTNYRAIAINFSDSLIGWVTVYGFSKGHDCKILHTTDGGNTWSDQHAFSSYYYPVYDIKDIFFLDSKNGWVTFRSITGWFILHTSDGGDSWYDQHTGMAFYDLPSVCFVDSLTGWAVGENTIVHSYDGGDNWLPQNTITNLHLHSVCFVDDSTGWASGTKMIKGICAWQNIVIHTKDGGKTWYEQPGNKAPTIGELFFVDNLHGWMVSFDFMLPSNSIMRTIDGGISWEHINIGYGNGGLSSIFFIDSLNGWVVGGEGAILHTINGGIDWEDQSIDSSNLHFYKVCFVDLYNGWAVGRYKIDDNLYQGQIYHTSDGGNSWEEQYSLMEVPFVSMHFTDQNTGWVVGDSIILHTTNGGNTWQSQSSGISHLNSIFFSDPGHGWAVGNPDIIYTTDGGSTWNNQSSGTNKNLYDIYFTDQNHGWIVGELGTILYTENGGATEIPTIKIPNSNPLLQIYPNPFSNQTTIEFTLSEPDFVTLSIFDITGKHLKTILSKQLSKGNHKINWNAESLKEGIYFIRLATNTGSIVQKALIMK